MIKNKKTHRTHAHWIALGMTTLALAGCTKERAYDQVYRPKDLAKELIDTSYDSRASGVNGSGVYLYLSSMADGPHSTESVFPGEMGDERLVRFRFTENELVAETIEQDPRFKSGATSNRPMMVIPVTHHAYRCAENAAGDCSNREEENSEIAWQKKGFFRPDVENLKVQEVSSLDVDLSAYFSMGQCLREVGRRVVDFQVEKGTLKIVMERDYQRQAMCASLQELWQLPSLTFSMRQTYSFVKRESLVSKNYVPVLHPEADSDRFGFFTTKQFRLATDYSDLRGSLKSVMERWNPSRKVIHYGLTANFAKPENAALLKATRESVSAVNAGFKAAGVDLRIELGEPGDQDYTDIRNSMIVLVEEPLEHGVLGYGPTVADPVTGEILSGRVVMYSGNMVAGLSSSWDEFIIHTADLPKLQSGARASSSSTANGASAPIASREVNRFRKAMESVRKSTGISSHSFEATVAGGERRVDLSRLEQNIAKSLNRAEAFARKAPKQDSFMKGIIEKLAKGNAPEGEMLRHRSAIEAFSKKCLYLADSVNYSGALSLDEIREELADLPRVSWNELNESQRARVIQALIPYVWIPTLVHELGHNMGLRHNFAGSEDQENFYTRTEVEQHGHRSAPMNYSSVMDYGFSVFKELRIMGKYDVAALRFGYARQVEIREKESGKSRLVPVKSTLEALLPEVGGAAALKAYKFCTDENVGSGIGCRRFDEGTTYGEIAEHMLKTYERYYRYRNFRNGARSFHEGSDGSYIGRTIRRFVEMRPFMDIPELIADLIQVPIDEEIWKQHPFLKPYRDAYDSARDMMLSPLKTPNVTCRIGKPVKAGVEPVTRDVEMDLLVWEKANLSKGAFFESCFDPVFQAALKEETGEVVYGHFGKSLYNQKFDSNPDSDAGEIDVRGNWSDKLAGFWIALMRETQMKTADTVRSNYFEMDEESRKEILQILNGYLMNRLAVVSPMKTSMGEMRLTEALIRPNRKLPRVYLDGAREVLGVPGYEVHLAEVLLTRFLKEMWTPHVSDLYQAVRDHYGISLERQLLPSESADEFVKFAYQGKIYQFHKERNSFAMEVKEKLDRVKTLEMADEAATKAEESLVLGEFMADLKQANPEMSESDLQALFKKQLQDRTVVAELVKKLQKRIATRREALLYVAYARVQPPENEEHQKIIAEMAARLTSEAEKAAVMIEPEFIEAVRAGDLEGSAYLAGIFEVLLRANQAADAEIAARSYVSRSE